MKISDFVSNKTMEDSLDESVVQKNGRFYPMTGNGKPIGVKNGYATAREAVRAFYMHVLTTFVYLDPERQDALVNTYMQKRGLK